MNTKSSKPVFALWETGTAHRWRLSVQKQQRDPCDVMLVPRLLTTSQQSYKEPKFSKMKNEKESEPLKLPPFVRVNIKSTGETPLCHGGPPITPCALHRCLSFTHRISPCEQAQTDARARDCQQGCMISPCVTVIQPMVQRQRYNQHSCTQHW
jgi:hypothetical protein